MTKAPGQINTKDTIVQNASSPTLSKLGLMCIYNVVLRKRESFHSGYSVQKKEQGVENGNLDFLNRHVKIIICNLS